MFSLFDEDGGSTYGGKEGHNIKEYYLLSFVKKKDFTLGTTLGLE
jgi:hypothetical protein